MNKSNIEEFFKGQNNTRNFENIQTKSGLKITSNIIRSNIITTKEQVSAVIDNDIKTIIDLRIKEEGGGLFKNPIYPNATTKHLPIAFGNLDIKKISSLLMNNDIEKIDLFMENSYRTFSSNFKSEIKTFFSLLLNKNNLPIVFHCTAGKDRTGMLATLFLIALGVSKNDIFNDYMKTNTMIDINKLSKKIAEYFKLDLSINEYEYSIKPFQLIFMVKQHWLEIFLEGINEKFGNVESYLKDEIRLDTKQLKKIYLS